ncbi:MAG: carbohydrate porin [Endomicrobium sp.]|jgi:carbohydrate-selective porin OprB|nr:carbohydrate porin [Endomicrobium sp.]
MKKFTVKTIILTFLPFVLIYPELSAQYIKKPADEAQAFDIKVSGGGTFFIYGTPESNVDESKDKSKSGVYIADFKLEKGLKNGGKIAASLKGGFGNGLSGTVETYADFPSFTAGEIECIKITELYYQQSFFNNKLTLNFGKLNFGSYFAGNRYSKDKSSQFITSIFSGDTIIETPPQKVALNLCYSLSDRFDLSYGCYASSLNDITANLMHAAQINYKPSDKGNYKLYYWYNNSIHYSCKNMSSKFGNFGFGISADHELNKFIGIFGRFSCKDFSTAVIKNGKPALDKPTLSWNLGLQIQGTAWLRKNDIVGFAIGQVYGSSEFEKLDDDYESGNETVCELYYKIGVNEHISITPSLEYFINPEGGNTDFDNNVFVSGIRIRFNF